VSTAGVARGEEAENHGEEIEGGVITVSVLRLNALEAEIPVSCAGALSKRDFLPFLRKAALMTLYHLNRCGLSLC
jgi:hypothetical protein